MTSMSVAVSGSLVSGSGGIGVSRTGSGGGGGGGRIVSLAGGGGGMGFATGGFFLEHAPMPAASAIATTTADTRLLFMLSLFVDALIASLMRSLRPVRISIPSGLRNLTKILAVPVDEVDLLARPMRSDENAMWRPFGENAGLSLLPVPSVIVRV